MYNKIWIFILSLSLLFINAKGQESDFGTWYNVELKGELFNLLDFAIIPEIRLAENSSRIDDLIGEIELSVPIANNFRFGTIYRYTFSPNTDGVPDIANRFAAFGQANIKIDRLRIAYHAILGEEFQNYYTSADGSIPIVQHRHKISLKYNRKKWDITPFISTELFFTLKPVWEKERVKSRTTIGFQYAINKQTDLSLSYRLDREFFVNNPKTNYILCFGISYQLK